VHYLRRVLAELPVKVRMIVRVHAALEDFGIDGPIKEPRRDTQRADLIAGAPCSADLIGLQFMCRGPAKASTDIGSSET